MWSLVSGFFSLSIMFVRFIHDICFGGLFLLLLSSIPLMGMHVLLESLMNLDFNFLWSKWNSLNIGT